MPSNDFAIMENTFTNSSGDKINPSHEAEKTHARPKKFSIQLRTDPEKGTFSILTNDPKIT